VTTNCCELAVVLLGDAVDGVHPGDGDDVALLEGAGDRVDHRVVPVWLAPLNVPAVKVPVVCTRTV
jgi:hypothetical protein